jgi:putative transposase
MPNHVHLILNPDSSDALARAVGEAHRRYTLAINQREGWSGYLWQGRFSSYPLDPGHLMNAARYVLLNPARAGLVRCASEWPHSSLRAHLTGFSDGLVDPEPLARLVADWARFLELPDRAIECETFRRHQRTGRPMGSTEFIRRLERRLDRRLQPGRPGRPKAASRERTGGHNTDS